MTKSLIKLIAGTTVIAGATYPAGAGEFDAGLNEPAAGEIFKWIADPSIIAAIHAQNQITGGHADAEIASLDKACRCEISPAVQPNFDADLSGPDEPQHHCARDRRDNRSGYGWRHCRAFELAFAA